MNLKMNKGNYPGYSPDIKLISAGGGQYEMTTQLTNTTTSDAVSQVLFYWATAGTPGALNQLNGWGLPAYVIPFTGFSNPTAPLLNPALSGPPSGPLNTLIWMPDANVFNTIAGSFDPAHIMIIAQIISTTPTLTTHPNDFNWWPGLNTWVGAGVFSWP